VADEDYTAQHVPIIDARLAAAHLQSCGQAAPPVNRSARNGFSSVNFCAEADWCRQRLTKGA
jgi:hypothetical protein